MKRKLRSVLRVVAPLVLLAVAALPLAAQEQVGAVEGVIADESGAPVPGVTVEARNQAGLTLHSVTDVRGAYRFPALPPGAWVLTARLAGFKPARTEDVRLALGQLLQVDITLEVGSVEETITVSGESPLIDTRQSASSANIRDEMITKIPHGRDFLTVASQAPGANIENISGGLSIDGASGADNRFIIDGLDTTNLQEGVSGKRLVTDFVEEVQVKSSGYTAEYGGATGGVVNVITKSGTNDFHGSVGAYLSADYLDADRRPSLRIDPLDDTAAEHVTYPKDDYATWEPGFTLGGPLLRDRLWFFTAYMPQVTNTDRTVTFVSDGETRTVTRRDRTHFVTANIAAQLGSKIRTKVGANWAPYSRDGVLPELDGTSDPATPFGDFDRAQPNLGVSGNVDYLAGPELYLSLRGGYFRTDLRDLGNPDEVRFQFARTNASMPGVPEDLVRPRNWDNIPTNLGTPKDVQSRLSFQLDGTWFARFAGTHALKAGVQVDRIANDVVSGYQKQRVIFYWGDTYTATDGTRVDGPYGYARVYYYGTYGDAQSNNYGLFVQDSWSVNDRLTLNLGLRSEKENVPSFSDDPNVPNPAVDFGFADKLAPRAGFAYDLRGDGRSKLYGSWGIFYDIMKLELPRGSFGGDKWVDHRYTIDSPDWPTTGSNPECPPACDNMTLIEIVDRRRPSNDPEDYTIDPNLKPMRSQEVVLGMQHDLGHDMSVGVRYVHKQLDRAIEDQGILVGSDEVFYITNPGEGTGRSLIPGMPDQPRPQRDYDAVEVDFHKRMSDRWSLSAKYWWSRLYGNYSGLASSDEVYLYDDMYDPGQTRRARTSPNVNRDFDALAMSFQEGGVPVYGLLPADRPHQFKLQGLYDFSFGTTVGTGVYLASGTPVSRFATISPGISPIYYRGRGSDGRSPTVFQVDLYLQHEFRLSDRTRLQLSANVINLLDLDTPTQVWSDLTQEEVPLTTEEYIAGASIDRAIASSGVLLDPRFGQASFYLPPRTIRLAARLTF